MRDGYFGIVVIVERRIDEPFETVVVKCRVNSDEGANIVLADS